MPTFPDYEVPPATPHIISSVGRYSADRNGLRMAGSNAASAAWTPAASGTVIYVPFYLPFAYPVNRIWWFNGSTITSSNIDCGVMGQDGTKIFSSGLTAMSGASAIQYASLSNAVILPKGGYWFAYNIVAATLTSRGHGINPTNTYLRIAGLMQQTGQTSGIPNAATFSSYVGPGLPLMGITRTLTGF